MAITPVKPLPKVKPLKTEGTKKTNKQRKTEGTRKMDKPRKYKGNMIK